MRAETADCPQTCIGRMNCDDLPDPAEDRRIMSGLTRERQEKILRFRFPADRKRSLASALLLKEMLGKKGIAFSEVRTDARGKPFIEADPPVYISVSHAGMSALAAVSDVPVGCDIEPVRKFPEMVVRRCFSEEEKQMMNRCLSEEERRRCFFSIWTARESYIKMTGEGLGLSFDRYAVIPAEEGGPDGKMRFFTGTEGIPAPAAAFSVLRDGRKEDCRIRQSFSSDQYCISVCTGVCHPSLE